MEAEARAQNAIADALAEEAEITEPALHAALGRAYRDGELVYTSSSMPIRDQEAFLAPGEADVLFLCNRGANGIDGLISSGIGAAQESGRPTTSWRKVRSGWKAYWKLKVLDTWSKRLGIQKP